MLKSVIVVIFIVLLVGCEKAPQTTPEEKNAATVNEYEVHSIRLSDEVADPNQEVSGLTWFNNNLIILPQFAISSGDTLGYLYSIPKGEIIASINSGGNKIISPKRLEIIGHNLDEYLGDGSGFEAITFKDNTVFISLEKSGFLKTESYIIKGVYDSLKKHIVLDSKTLAKIESASGIDNHGEEAISFWNNNIFTIHESNGRNLVDAPKINLIDLELNYNGYLPFPHIEYRITDVTHPDSTGKFWALNYFWPGDYSSQQPAQDSLTIKYGVGVTHKKFATIERIVEMQITDKGVNLTNRPPIQLKLLANNVSRNWEGIVKLDNKGFIIVTDKFPSTILGFVEYPGN